ncbi:MAG TPA: hypothetical protein VF494_03805 [Candidatus Limnocylindrales bacterium]
MAAGATPPPWLQTVVSNVLGYGWPDPATNNSNGVRFTYSSSNDVVVYWSTTSIPACDVNVRNWLGCADNSQGRPYKIWIRRNLTTVGWKNWCDLSYQTGCPDAGRTTIAEVGHVGGFLKDDQTDKTLSVMLTGGFPTATQPTWNARTVGRCDEAALQLMYGVDDRSRPYAECFDDITNAGTYGLRTGMAVTPSATFVCYGQGITISGRLFVQDYSSYGPLGGNNIASHTVWIDRRVGGTSTWTEDYRTVTTSTASSGNTWSIIESVSGSSGSVTYEYRADWHRPSLEGLDSSTSSTLSLTWSSAC